MSAAVADWDAARLTSWSEPHLARVEAALSRWVGVDAPVLLGDAMRYAVLDGGKRLRPLLVLAASEAVGGNAAAALRAACATELIHAYSLVHDDLPSMDNDVLRRGKPTVHVKFGEADALLAGDALQALAFELLTPEGDEIPAATQATLCRLLARAAGSQGMAGGQAIDLASVGLALNEAQLREMHRLKTGALLQGSVEMGAACAANVAPTALAALRDYGAAIGLAFQVVRRHPRRDRRFANPWQDGRQGRRRGQAHLCLAVGPRRRACAGKTAARRIARGTRAQRPRRYRGTACAGPHGRRPRPMNC